MDEHSAKNGLPLTTKAAERIVEETQPEGTKATIVGKNDPRPDIIYQDAAAQRLIDKILVEVFGGQVVEFVFGQEERIERRLGKSLLAVDPQGNILLKLQPFP